MMYHVPLLKSLQQTFITLRIQSKPSLWITGLYLSQHICLGFILFLKLVKLFLSCSLHLWFSCLKCSYPASQICLLLFIEVLNVTSLNRPPVTHVWAVSCLPLQFALYPVIVSKELVRTWNEQCNCLYGFFLSHYGLSEVSGILRLTSAPQCLINGVNM